MTPQQAPVPPPRKARPPRGLASRAFGVISSPRLAIALLIAVLACCVVGVTAITGERAMVLIFNAVWFNALLTLLAMSSGLTFFGRIWGRKVTLISVGMIVFHISFMSMLGGVVYNSLFHFNGVLRLTEGETLPNNDPASYDFIEAGRFFELSRFRGETTLIRMHNGYKVEGLNKRAAYEIQVGEGANKTSDTIYMTQNLDHGGVRYLVSKEGYSIGVILYDPKGTELNATMVPLQSLSSGGPGSFIYTSGTSLEPAPFLFPPPPNAPALLLQVQYVPDKQKERGGQVEFFTWPLAEPEVEKAAEAVQGHGPAVGQGHGSAVGTGHEPAMGPRREPASGISTTTPKGRSGKVAIGQRFDAGDHLLAAGEVRYWVGMNVRHDPGLLVILASLWAGLGGMTMTFAGRIWQDVKREKRDATKRETSGHAPGAVAPRENS